MTAIQTPEERITELLKLRDRIDAEIARLNYGLTPTRKRPRSVIPDCGTESGYQWHRNRDEKCDECRVAHARHERVASIARKARRESAA